MSIKDILLTKINFIGNKKSLGKNLDDCEFRRVINLKERAKDDDTGAESAVFRKSTRLITASMTPRKNLIILAPMRSLSLEDFNFPFSNSTKIREALKLQVMPFSAAGELEVFPVVLSKTPKGGSNGIVWYVSPEEFNIPESDINLPKKVWPAPLPFISKLSKYGGSGVTIWLDEENICSMLWQKNRPVLSRWRKLVDKDSEIKEIEWYDEYCKVQGLDRGGNFTVNAAGENLNGDADEMFFEIVNESSELCPWINDVNLSRSAIEGARDLERSVRLLTRVSIWLLIAGVIALGASVLRWKQIQSQVQEIRTKSENFYRQTFDPSHIGRIANPVTLARDKLAEFSGTGADVHSLQEALEDLGEIFAADKNMNITIDIVRYSNEGMDCTGVAPDMSTILNFRKLWEGKVNLVQLDNTQFVAGVGYRFDLRLRW
ncbi:MAG: hypothetical protein IJQ99_05545 [Synergistaceae bacterium]|nr:hypothetical protein [Synergistaceae bacterium]